MHQVYLTITSTHACTKSLGRMTTRQDNLDSHSHMSLILKLIARWLGCMQVIINRTRWQVLWNSYHRLLNKCLWAWRDQRWLLQLENLVVAQYLLLSLLTQGTSLHRLGISILVNRIEISLIRRRKIWWVNNLCFYLENQILFSFLLLSVRLLRKYLRRLY